MFEDKGPMGAANAAQEFMEDHGSKLTPTMKEKLREKLRETSPVPKLLGGMEILYTLALETPLTNAAAREATLQTLGVVATVCGEGQYRSMGDRAWAIQAWTAYKLNPIGTEPATPDVDPAYTTVVAEPPTQLVPEPAPAE